MMQSLYTPWTVAWFFAYFVWFAAPAYFILAFRVVFGKVSRKEMLLLGMFLALVAAEILQLKAATADIPFDARGIWGLPRYFSVFGPFLWVWCAWLVARSRVIAKPRIGVFARVFAAAFLLFVFGNECIRFFVHQCSFSDGVDALSAARRVAGLIRHDYAGPSRFEDIPFAQWEYYTSRRPVVFGNYGAAAWVVRGQSEGANVGFYPKPPDYLMLNLDRKGYNGSNLNPADFEQIANTHGTTCRWALFRRKGVPHKIR